MQTPNQLFRLLTEMAFLLLGGLLLWVGLFGRFLFNPRQASWLVVSAVLVFWGLRSWRQAGKAVFPRDRIAARIGGGSLFLAGILLLSLGWVSFRWSGLLLAVVGGVFVLRGFATAVLMARP